MSNLNIHRFLAFAWDTQCAQGGMHDCVGVFATKADAKSHLRAVCPDMDNHEVVNLALFAAFERTCLPGHDLHSTDPS